MIEITIKRKSKKNLGLHILSNNTLFAELLALEVICYGVVRSGHDNYRTNIIYLITIAIGILTIGKRKLKKNFTGKELLVFIFVAIVELPFQMLNGKYYNLNNALSGLLTFSMMSLTIAMLVNANNKFLWKLINGIVLVASVLIIFQVLAKLVGIRLDQLGTISDIFFKAWEFNNGKFFRPSSLFSEPSHFAEIALISFFYYLFINFSRIKISIIGIALVFSTSSLGIIGAIILVGLYVFNMPKVHNIARWKKTLGMIMTFIVAIFLIILVEDTSNTVIARILSGGTASVRVFRSFELFSKLSFGEKVWGIGIQNQELYLNCYNIILRNDNYETLYSNREFAQTFGYVLCTTGIIGLIALYVPLLKLALKYDYQIKAFICLFLFVCLVACIFSRAIFLLYLWAFYSIIEMKKNDIQNFVL